jgi:hypothetical protein
MGGLELDFNDSNSSKKSLAKLERSPMGPRTKTSS